VPIIRPMNMTNMTTTSAGGIGVGGGLGSSQSDSAASPRMILGARVLTVAALLAYGSIFSVLL
jgi:hypothetical protein